MSPLQFCLYGNGLKATWVICRVVRVPDAGRELTGIGVVVALGRDEQLRVEAAVRPEIVARFVALAGGPESEFVVIPTATEAEKVDPQRVREVAALIPGAMRGLVSERQLGSYADLDEARRGLTNALATYLDQSRPS